MWRSSRFFLRTEYAAAYCGAVDIPVPAGGGLHGIRLDPGGPSSSAVLRHERGHRDLRTFAFDVKSARSAGSSSARVHPHSSSRTLAAYEAEERAYPDFEYQFYVASPGYEDGSRLGQGLPVGS